MAALRDTKLWFFFCFWFFKLDFQRNELLGTTVFLTGHKKHFNSFVRVVFVFKRAHYAIGIN